MIDTMRLVSPDGDPRIEIEIWDYQFPEDDDPGWTWLVVDGRVSAAEVSWTFRDASITAGDAARIGEWLYEVAEWLDEPEKHPRPGRIDFIEPNLAFDVVDVGPGAAVRVELELEARSPHNRAYVGCGHPDVIDCQMSPQLLRQAAAEWEHNRSHFPARSA